MFLDGAANSSLKLRSQGEASTELHRQESDGQALLLHKPELISQPTIGVKEIKNLGKRTVVPTPDQLSRATKRKIKEQINQFNGLH